MLQDNILVRLVEDGSAIAVNLSKGLVPFPQPSFNWIKDGQLLSSSALTYSSVTFDNIRRVDAGICNVSASNFVLNRLDAGMSSCISYHHHRSQLCLPQNTLVCTFSCTTWSQNIRNSVYCNFQKVCQRLCGLTSRAEPICSLSYADYSHLCHP